MDNQSALLNDKWKNYFNWTILYPTVFFTLIAVAVIGFIINSISTLGESFFSNLSEQTVFGFAGGLFGAFFIGGILFMVAMFVYLIWFIIASDTLFKLLGVNRTVGNTLNLVGLVLCGGLSFIVLPVYFWIKMRDYWIIQGQKSSWRAVA